MFVHDFFVRQIHYAPALSSDPGLKNTDIVKRTISTPAIDLKKKKKLAQFTVGTYLYVQRKVRSVLVSQQRNPGAAILHNFGGETTCGATPGLHYVLLVTNR